MRPKLSIVILCYRAEEGARRFVAEVVSTLADLPDPWELVLVANFHDGDDDSTPSVVREIASGDARFKIVAKPKRGMMGWDARQGFAAATGAVIALIDGDGQMPARDLLRVYETLKNDHLDLVKTYRASRHDGLLRRLNSWAYNSVYRVLFPGYPVRDVNSKPKVFTREFLERIHLESDDWFLDAEIMIQACRTCARVAEIPTTFGRLEGRRSFVHAALIVEFARNLLRARIREFFVR